MKKEELIVKIVDEDTRGNGIAKIDGKVIFVPKSLTGETVRINITEHNKRYDKGNVIEIIEPSDRRITPLCKNFDKCGGCNYQHISYKEEIKIKEKYIGNLFNIKIDNFITNDETSYRNKLELHVQNETLGFYKKETNTLVPFNTCNLISDKANITLNFINSTYLKKVTKVMLRESKATKEILLSIKGDEDYPYIDNIRNNCEVNSIYFNDKLVYGKPYITEIINDYKFLINHKSFLQVNSKGMEKLYNQIKKYAGTGTNLLDLYCGTGTIGIYLTKSFEKVTGVDILEDNIKLANLNKDENKIDNIEFILGDSKIISDNNYDTIIVDPPRSGLSKEVINNLLEMKSNKIVYVSCNPTTLKRDISLLNDYELKKLSVVDMFPKTMHVECVCVLNRSQTL